MDKWLPEWLARNYFRLEREAKETLWSDSRTNTSASQIPFSFKQAQEILGASDAVTQKTLWELEIRGFLLKRREETKLSAKRYFLAPFSELLDVFRIYFKFQHKEFEKLSLERKLVIAPWPYLLTGKTAAYHYSHYQSPGRVLEIETKTGDRNKWMAFLSDRRTVVNPDAPIETRRAKQYVHLMPWLHGSENDFVDVDGLKLKRIEPLLLDLIRDNTLSGATQAIALVVSKNKPTPINWKELVSEAEKQQLLRYLGCLLDVVNAEARTHVVEPRIIKEIHSRQPISVEVRLYPEKEAAEYEELNRRIYRGWLSRADVETLARRKEALRYYSNIGQKWNMEILLPKAAVRKVLDDLGVELRDA